MPGKYPNMSSWLNSGEYHTQIDTVLTKIVRDCEMSDSEAHTSSIFEREIYFLVRSQLGIELNFSKETPVEGVVHKFEGLSSRKSGHGRLDAVVNNVIIEYKHHSRLKTDKQISSAFEQVKDYLVALKRHERIKYDAVLTDGVKVAYFQFIGDAVENTSLRNMSVDDIDRIIRAILNNKSKKFEPSNIVRDFSISSVSASAARNVARILFGQLTSSITEKSQMLYSEWKELMHLSVEDNGKSGDIAKRRLDLSSVFANNITEAETEYKALFALQTTYAIIVKLIACKVVDKLNFNEETHEYHDLSALTVEKMQKFFQNMEDGYSYTSMGIRNFLEGDFFSWYTAPEQWSEEFWRNIKDIIRTLDDYSSFSLNVKYNPIDIFKDLYMSIIPQSVRHSMGEYFTPEWLADCVITEALKGISNKEWTAIDPCCGSGIFIIALIKKIVGDTDINDLSGCERKRLLDSILQRVHGIDINPLSVLSARVSYYIAIHQFGDVENIEIPVYLGDSAIVPIKERVDDIDCYRYSINNNRMGELKVLLPASYVDRDDFGGKMNKLQALVKAESSDVLYNNIIQDFTDEERKSPSLMKSVRELAANLVALHKNKWDGIWIRIATNFMLIARLRKHDLIIGNPPWVKWEHLPAAYTRKIKEFCDVRHIFCNDGMYGGAQLNLCALISNVAATNWLSASGILAFLMPDSIMSQNSYEEFRNFYVDAKKSRRLYLQKLDRWRAPLRPFKVGNKSVTQDFNTYFYSSCYVDYKAGVRVRSISKKHGIDDKIINGCASYHDAGKYLEIKEETARQLADNSTQFTYVSGNFDYSAIIGETSYLYRTGVESTPFEIFKMTGEGMSAKPGHYRFKNKVLKTSKYKVDDVPIHGWDFPVGLIFPMVEGPAISPYSFDCGNNFHIIPYDINDTSSPIPLEELTRTNEELAVYFCNHRDLLDQQSEKSKTMHRGTEFYALSKIGPYTFAPYIVAARDNSNFCSSIIRPVKTPWGDVKAPVCVKHTIIISQDKDKNFITEDESHYINAILNSSIVHSYIHATFKSNGFSLKKSNLCIPKFNPSDRLHRRLAALSKIASRQEYEGKRKRVSDLSSVLYVQVCKDFKAMSENKKYDVDFDDTLSMAAEQTPFELYHWKRIENNIVDMLGDSRTILVGGYKNKKHLNWIMTAKMYNIRLGNRKGSVDERSKCISDASVLILYNIAEPSECVLFEISSPRVLTGKELRYLGYPRKSPGKRYMVYDIKPASFNAGTLSEGKIIENLLTNLPNHIKGTPLFLEP